MRDSMLAIATRDRFELFDRSRLGEGFSVGGDTNAASSTNAEDTSPRGTSDYTQPTPTPDRERAHEHEHDNDNEDDHIPATKGEEEEALGIPRSTMTPRHPPRRSTKRFLKWRASRRKLKSFTTPRKRTFCAVTRRAGTAPTGAGR